MNESFLLPLHESIAKQKENLYCFSLKNGLEVVFFKDTSKPKVFIQVAYNVGSAAESSSEKGLAHLVEHMIFKGTKNLSEGDIDAISRKFGAEYNAFTSQDLTAYYFDVEKNSWEYFLTILSECMFFSRFEEEHLSSELKAVVQELNLYVDDFETKVAEKAIELSFPPNHPYHFPIIGFKNTLANCSAKDLINFYKKHYLPKNAVLVLVGDFDFSRAQELITKQFELNIPENLNLETSPLKNNFTFKALNLTSLELSMIEEVEQEKITFFWPIPGLVDSITPISDVLLELIGGGINSRFYKRFVDKEKIAKDISVQIDLMHYAGILFINILPNSLADLDKIKLILLDEFDKICKDGFAENEINRAKKSLALVYIRSTESWQNLANGFIIELFLRKKPSLFFDYLEQLNSVVNLDLQKFVNDFFNPECLSVIKLKKITEKLREFSLQNRALIKEEEDLILKNHVRTTPLEKPDFVNQLPHPNFLYFNFPKPTDIIKTSKNINLLFYAKEAYPITFFKMMFKNSFILNKSKEGFLVDLMMQCLVEQSVKYSKYENLDYLDDLGAHIVFDIDGICLTSLVDSFLPALNRVLYMFSNPMFTQIALEKQKEILLADLSERQEDPQKMGVKAFYQHFYPSSEFDWSFQEAINFIKEITLEDLKEIHKKYFNPESLLVAFSGSFDKVEIIKLIEECFNKNLFLKFDLNYPESIKTPFVLNLPMLRDQTTLLLAKTSDVKIEDPDYLALSILNIVLFYSLGSRVYQIRERRGAFYSLFGGFALDASHFGSIDYICTTLNTADVERTKKEILYEIDLVRENGITEEEFFAARQLYLGSLVNLFSDIPSVTQVMLSLSQFNLSFNYYDFLLKRLEEITIQDINLVAKKRLITNDLGEILIGNL